MSAPTHPLDLQVFRKNAEYSPLPTVHYAKTQYLTYPFAVDVEATSNYISEDLIDILKLHVYPHPRPYYLDSQHPILFQCKLPFKVGKYEDEILCDVTNFGSVCVILGHKWITNKQIRYNWRRTEFIYPWMEKVAPQPTPLVEPKSDPTPLPEPAPKVEPEPTMEPALMVEPAPMMKPEPILETSPMMEPDPVPEPEIDVFVAEPVPTPEPEAVSGPDPTPKLVPESAPEEVKLLHEYLDPFLPPDPGTPAFQLYFDELLLWWVTYVLMPSLCARSTRMGLHHQLLKTCLGDFHYINSRTSFSHQGSLMRSYSANGWANPTS